MGKNENMNDSNPGMVERQMDETPMEGRDSTQDSGTDEGRMRSGAEGDGSLQNQDNRTGGYGMDTPADLNNTSDGMSANDRMGELGRSTRPRDGRASEGLGANNRDW